ncbi:traub transciption factor family protein [Pyrenochaeta sp. MPI-SDFR-AT-0127]|nr:traub transciption factor family protein [Pyrenochaeta sp. MPI-SDFR-AT-0127]
MGKSKIKDFDPESLLDPAPSSSSDGGSDSELSDAGDDNAGREHYTAVGKSKLRKAKEVALGPEYAGRGVSRKELEDSDSDDPFARGFDEEDSEASDEGGAENIDGVDEEESEEEGLDADFDEDISDDDEDMGSDAEDESDKDEEDEEALANSDEGQARDISKSGASAVRDLMKDAKSFSSTLAASVQSDVAKGQAIKTQRKTFDSLLNTRIRLQKALISTNSLAADPYKAESAPEASIEAAEAAALTLLNNLTDLRHSLEEARTGHKRKRTQFDSSTPSSEIWSNIRSTETSALAHRKAVLERWSKKTKATTVTNNKARLNASAQQTLTEVLDTQLTSSHLVTRTQTPRSCAPLQSSVKAALPDPAIYDDADFYGLLLKELLEQRSADINSNGAAEFVVQAPWQVAREAKTKKVVDTKASKGRRLRYTVQEKLQNFMAPEERGDWGERQRDDLFSSLFGQRLGLGENEDVESEQEEVDAEEAGLMLFRN